MEIKNQPILLFDLGNIVIEFVGLTEIQRLYRPDLTKDEIHKKWISTKAIVEFETGKINPAQFAHQFVKEWELAIAEDEFLHLFIHWSKEPFIGMPDLLSNLAVKYTTACLSNINELHWHRVGTEQKMAQHFHHHYLSYKIGLSKPDIRIYQEVVKDLQIPPSKIIFFDDLEENVIGARSLGFNAHQVKGFEQVQAKCIELGLI